MATGVESLRQDARCAPPWPSVRSSMADHLEWLERWAGTPSARDVVATAIQRLERQLARLEAAADQTSRMAAATALRDCGALVCSAALTARAAALLDRTRSGRRTSVATLAQEARRTVRWLQTWRALTTPQRSWGTPAVGMDPAAQPHGETA